MVKLKLKNLNFTALSIVLLITIITPLTAAQNSTSTHLTPNDISAAPTILLYEIDESWPIGHYANPDWANPTITVDNNSATIELFVGLARDVYVPAALGTIMNGGGYLIEVTYKASWLDNKTVTAYRGSSQSSLKLYLQDIPYGKQTIQVNASCNVLLFNSFPDDLSTYPVPQNNTSTINFTVVSSTETPTPMPASVTAISLQPIPTETAYALTIVALAIASTAIYVVAKQTSNKSNTTGG